MKSDQSILCALSGNGAVVASQRCYCLKRNGHLLLALPKDRDLARVSLELYQPQSIRAKVAITIVRLLVSLNLHIWMPHIDIKAANESVFGKLLSGGCQLGFLLGNPDGSSRKVIVAQRDAGSYEVSKVGVGSAAKLSVNHEEKFVRSLREVYTGVPHILESSNTDAYSSYTTTYVSGRSPQHDDDPLVLGVLESWMRLSKPCNVSDTSIWALMKKEAEATGTSEFIDVVKQLEGLVIKQGLYHGDFAPWNIKISSGDEVHVMDWEFASLDGFAAWDWIHYLLQRAILVEDQSEEEAIEVCRKWANTDRGRDFMNTAGWGHNIELCLGSYLLYSKILARFEHEDLLAEWMKQ
jgi:hypothetical protein